MKTTISNIAPAQEYYAAYQSDNDNDIDSRIERIICWSVIKFLDTDDEDEVVGQIFNGQCIAEANMVDDEDGFGALVGYYATGHEASEAIKKAENEKYNDNEDDEDNEDDDE